MINIHYIQNRFYSLSAGRRPPTGRAAVCAAAVLRLLQQIQQDLLVPFMVYHLAIYRKSA